MSDSQVSGYGAPHQAVSIGTPMSRCRLDLVVTWSWHGTSEARSNQNSIGAGHSRCDGFSVTAVNGSDKPESFGSVIFSRISSRPKVMTHVGANRQLQAFKFWGFQPSMRQEEKKKRYSSWLHKAVRKSFDLPPQIPARPLALGSAKCMRATPKMRLSKPSAKLHL